MTTLADDALIEHRLEFAPGADLRATPGSYAWTDITGYLLPGQGITLQYGGSGESSQPTTTLSFTLANPAGEFTVDHPGSPWPGQWDRGVPVRHSTRTDGATWVVESVTYVREITYTTAGSARSDGVGARVQVQSAGRLTWVAQWDDQPDTVTRHVAWLAPAQWLPLDRPSVQGITPSGLPDGTAGFVEGHLDAGDQSDPPGAFALSKLGIGTRVALPLTAPIGDSTGWGVSLLVQAPETAVHDAVHTFVYMHAEHRKLGVGWIYFDGIGEAISLAVYRRDGSTEASVTVWLASGGVTAYRPTSVDIQCFESAGTSRFRVQADNWELDSVTGLPARTSVATMMTFDVFSPGRLATAVEVSPYAQLDGWQVAHLALWGYAAPVRSLADTAAMVAFAGERVVTRIVRTCGEDGIPETVGVLAEDDTSEPMGPASPTTTIDVLRQCELTDHGVMDDHLGAITYRPRSSMYGQDPALVLDGDLGHLPATLPPPQLTDARLRNRVSASTTYGGQTATVEDADSIDRQGLIAYSPSGGLNLANASLLRQHALWSLGHGTLREPQYPALPVRLSTHPELVSQWRAVQLGSLIEVRHPPLPHRGPWRIQVRGVTVQWIGSKVWRASVVGVPYRPFEVAAVGTWRPGLTAQLAMPMSADQTYAVVDVVGPLATTDPGDYPVDMAIGLERVTATACSGTSSPQTLTLTRAVDGLGGTHVSGESVDLWRPLVIGL
jgi:hypothetical protein